MTKGEGGQLIWINTWRNFCDVILERILTDDPDDEGVAGEGGERQDGVDGGQEDDGEDRVLAEVHLAGAHVWNWA